MVELAHVLSDFPTALITVLLDSECALGLEPRLSAWKAEVLVH